jgi:hypothetical protein
MLVDGDREERIGGVRETPRGFDALAVTFGYEPGRAKRGMTSLEEAKTFVESFKPWELFVTNQEVSIEPNVVPLG